MEIVPETKENVLAVRGGGLRPETKAALALQVDEAIRIRAHNHKTDATGKVCQLVVSLQKTCKRHGQQITTRHDGVDLLVLRIK